MTVISEEAVNAAHEAYDRVAAINPRLSYSTRVAVKAALTAALPFLPVQVAVNIDAIVQPLEDIHAPGGLCRWTDVATAIGEVRRALSALEPSAGRAAVLEEAARKAQKAIAAILMSGGLERDKWWDDLVSAQQSLAAAIRALSSPYHADAGKVEGDGWLPIESAPKDGTEIIYLTKYGSIGFCRYAVDDINDWFGWWDLQADDEVYPKFWISRSTLPSVPSEGSE